MMSNEELINALRLYAEESPESKLLNDAADALEAAEKRIAELEKRTKLPDRQEFLAKGSFIKEPLSRPKDDEWILCSERLPEDYEDVLVWFEYFRYGSYNRLYQTHGIGDYDSETDSWIINHQTGWHKLRVLAWMPLPEPYRKEQNDESN